MKDLFKQLLVPVSGSESSVVAGKLAIQLAKEHGSLLVFVHVVDVAVRDRLARLSGRTPDIVQRELEENGERYLNYMVRLAEGEGVKAEKVLRVGVTDVETIAEAETSGATLVVVGKPVYHGPRGEFFGRLARHIIERIPCPVLVVKAKEE